MGAEGPLVESRSLSELLANWQTGDQQTLEALLPVAYDELRRLAHRYLRKQRPDQTLLGTALVYEAHLRLEKQGAAPFRDRAHFVAICAQLMRPILVEYARNHRAAKRDGGCGLTLDDTVVFKSRSLDLVALEDALAELGKLNLQQSRIVELRFFGGLSIEEISHVLGISPATVNRHWTTARVWLHDEISRAKRHDT